jgi:hypothetical protein
VFVLFGERLKRSTCGIAVAGRSFVAVATGLAIGGEGEGANLKLSHVMAAAATARPEITSVDVERLLFLFTFIKHVASRSVSFESLHFNLTISAWHCCRTLNQGLGRHIATDSRQCRPAGITPFVLNSTSRQNPLVN